MHRIRKRYGRHSPYPIQAASEQKSPQARKLAASPPSTAKPAGCHFRLLPDAVRQSALMAQIFVCTFEGDM